MKARQFPRGGAKQPLRQGTGNDAKDGETTIVSLQVRMPHALYAYAQKRAAWDGQPGVRAYLMTLLKEALDQDWRYAMKAEEAAHVRKTRTGGR